MCNGCGAFQQTSTSLPHDLAGKCMLGSVLSVILAVFQNKPVPFLDRSS